MAQIEVEYLGQKITFNENSDTWSCWNLNIEHVSLAKVKEKIGEIDRQARNLDGIPVIEVRMRWGRLEETKMIANKIDAETDDKVWVTTLKDVGRYRTVMAERRAKMDVNDLIPDTPENRALLKEIDEEAQRIHALGKANEARLKAIPRFKLPEKLELTPLTDAQAEKFAGTKIRQRTR